MKKLLAVLLVVVFCCGLFAGCGSADKTPDSPFVLVDTVEDQYDNILNQLYYNEATGEYLLKEYIYELNGNKWVCIEQRTTIYESSPIVPGNSCYDTGLDIYYNSDLMDNSITIMDNEYTKISIVKYLAEDAWWEFGYELKIYNKTDKVLSTIITDTYIMDIFCEPVYNIEHLDPGKTAYFKLAWDEDTLTRCHIPYVDNVEFMIKVFDNNNWTAPALTGKRVMIKK